MRNEFPACVGGLPYSGFMVGEPSVELRHWDSSIRVSNFGSEDCAEVVWNRCCAILFLVPIVF